MLTIRAGTVGQGHQKRCQALVEAWGDKSGDWLVIDDCDATPADHRAIREAGHKLLVIDDNAHLSRYDCDILLNQNAHAKSLRYKTNKDCKQLLGPDYALIRREIAQLRDSSKTLSGCRRILLTLGGVPPEALMSTVVRRFHAWECELRICQGNADIVSAMAWADVAVSAAGVTALEVCCVGVPAVLIGAFPNQEANGKALDEARCGYYVPVAEVRIAALNSRLYAGMLLDSLLVWQHVRERQMALVDGRGPERVVEAMLGHLHPGD